MRITSLLLLSCMFIVQLSAQSYEYPETKQVIVNDTFHEKYMIQDSYRWLENTNSPEVIQWVAEQNKISKQLVNKARNKSDAALLIDRYGAIEYSMPVKDGDYYFTNAYYGNLGVPALFYGNSINADLKLLVDPNYISNKDRIVLKRYKVSKDSKYLAYQFSRNGSDWAEIKVVSTLFRKHEDDHLKYVRFSNIAWKDDGFYYSTYSRNGQFDKAVGQKIYYHKLGTDQSEDELIFKRENPNLFFYCQTTSDEQFLLIEEKNERRGTFNYFYLDFKEESPSLKPLLMNLPFEIGFVDSHKGKLIATTSYQANNGQIIEIDPLKPTQWKTIAAEFSRALLVKTKAMDDKIIAVYQSNQKPIITILDYDGNILYSEELRMGTSIRGFNGEPDDQELLYSYTSYTIPPIVYRFDVDTYKKKQSNQTKVNYYFQDIIYKEVEYYGKDSTLIPMILVYEEGLELDGNNPTILKAYGGFAAVNQPNFDPGVVYTIKKGGVFAFANIRGGGDLGIAWANDGKGLDKQNSFDDFISAAEYLIKEGYTSPEKLGITGGSNGGLVVAAAAIQRPDLFKVVVPVVAPLDMLRFERFSVGHFHTDEYGSVAQLSGFENLLQYSPYHNIIDSINYPSMLLVTSMNDDRVPPFHSYKFAAALQNRQAQENPVLLKVRKNAGHSGGSSLQSTIDELSDVYGFIMYQLKD